MKKILIVDDNPDIRALLHATLDLAQSFEIHEALDGVKAVELARSLKPDLVLMDIMMPGEFDGLEACRRIKQLNGDEGEPPKVLLVSAKPRDQVAGQLQQVGADAFMAKPFGPAQLVSCIMGLFQPKA